MKVNEIITNKIIDELSKGNIPWRKTWKGQRAVNYISRKEYRGMNLMLLPLPGEYLTFKQCQSVGGKVKKGEKSSMIIYWNFTKVKDGVDASGKDITKEVPFLKYYNVFHLSQCENIDTKLPEYAARNNNEIIADAEEIVNRYNAKNATLEILNVNGSDRAYYSPGMDQIVVPEISQFDGSREYYATLFHEMVHSTGHKSRLDRFSEQKSHSFGSRDYSKEELIAEIGSAFLSNSIGIDTEELFKNTVGYIQSWLQVLKNDANFVISAAGKAQKAVDLITA